MSVVINLLGLILRSYHLNIRNHIIILFMIGLMGAPIMEIVEKYVFSDWDFLGFLCILVIIDTCLGIWKGIKYKNFSSNSYGGLLEKVVVYGVCLITIHSIGSYMTSTANVGSFEILKTVAFHFDRLLYFSIMFRELWSINENINALGYKFLPTYILKYMKDFDENGNYKINNQQ